MKSDWSDHEWKWHVILLLAEKDKKCSGAHSEVIVVPVWKIKG